MTSVLLCGGIAGWIIARTRFGFVQGIVFAAQFVLFTGLVLALMPANFLGVEWSPWKCYVVLSSVTLVGGIIGGIVGGFIVRPRSGT